MTDQQMQTTLERIDQFQKQVAHLRRTETNPVNYRAAVSDGGDPSKKGKRN